ncbi:MAG: ElyC/SanA/YdcF family protein [Steroidobacteraceae bacterium]
MAGALASPLLLAALGSLCALALLVFLPRRRAGLILLALCATFLYCAAIPAIADRLLQPLEGFYPPLREDSLPVDTAAIVVLGNGYAPRSGIPVTSALFEDGLVRVVEGVRLARYFSLHYGWNIDLIMSGSEDEGRPASALGYAKLATQLGVSTDSIRMVTTPRDTSEEANAMSGLLGTRPFVLVTSAYHMRRAMLLMQRAGAKPIAAPTGHWVGGPSTWRPGWQGLRSTERALREYLALLAIRLGVAGTHAS